MDLNSSFVASSKYGLDSHSSYENFDNSYITISSDGKLVVYNNGKYESKINLLYEDAEKILQYIDIKKHIEKRSDFIKIERIHEGQI